MFWIDYVGQYFVYNIKYSRAGDFGDAIVFCDTSLAQYWLEICVQVAMSNPGQI